MSFFKLTTSKVNKYRWKYKKRLNILQYSKSSKQYKSPINNSYSKLFLKKLYWFNNWRSRTLMRKSWFFKNLSPAYKFFIRYNRCLKSKKISKNNKTSFLSLLKYKNYDFKDSGSAYVFKKFFFEFKINSLSFLQKFLFIGITIVPLFNETVFNNLAPDWVTNYSNFSKKHYFFKVSRYTSPIIHNNFKKFFFKAPVIKDNSLSFLKYLANWSFLLLHKHLLERNKKSRLLGLYPVTKDYFFYNNIFFPSFTNILIFRKSLRYSKVLNPITPKPLHSNLIFSNKIKRSLDFTFFLKKRSNLFFTKYVNLLKSRLELVKRSGPNKKVKRFLLKYFKKRLFFLRKKKSKNVHRKKRLSFLHIKYLNSAFITKLNFIDYIYKPFYVPLVNKYSGKFKFRNNLCSNFSFFKTKLLDNKTLIVSNVQIDFNNIFFKKYFLFLFSFKDSWFLKNLMCELNRYSSTKSFFFLNKYTSGFFSVSNLVPHNSFRLRLSKTLVLTRLGFFLKANLAPWTYNSIIRFIEFCSGKKAILQIYPFMNQAIDLDFVLLYKRWLPRFFYFERRLGHRFFLEEAFHILHMGFNLHDIKIISTWLKAIITRISFWKTRFIFRFLKYVFNNYFFYIFPQIGVKGFKVKLKGKISVAGNSRKRTILYRVGKTSHATASLKVLHNFSTIVTFTGVMGFQVWIFY